MGTHFRLVSTKRASSVLVVVMVVGASLEIVILWVLSARLNLERIQVKQENRLSHRDVASVESAAVKVFTRPTQIWVMLVELLIVIEGRVA